MRATVPASDVPVHEHEDAHAVLTLRGTYVSDAADMPLECNEPAIVFNPPGTKHRDRFGSEDGIFLVISLPAAAWASYAPTLTAPRSARRLGLDALATGLRLASTLGSGETAARVDLEGDVDSLLHIAARRSLPPLRRAPPWFARAREYLAAAETDCSLGELASDCGVHPAQLSRAFRRFEGCTPGQFLRRHRLQQMISRWAREELVSLTEAAHSAGFFDHAHMIRAMRQEIGMTPSDPRSLFRSARQVEG